MNDVAPDAVARLARLVGTETAKQLVEHIDPDRIDAAETLIAYGAPPASVPALAASLPPSPLVLHWLGQAITFGRLHVADPEDAPGHPGEADQPSEVPASWDLVAGEEVHPDVGALPGRRRAGRHRRGAGRGR